MNRSQVNLLNWHKFSSNFVTEAKAKDLADKAKAAEAKAKAAAEKEKAAKAAGKLT